MTIETDSVSTPEEAFMAANNPGSSPQALLALSTWNLRSDKMNWEIMTAVASNPSSPPEALFTVLRAGDPVDDGIRESVLDNPASPAELYSEIWNEQYSNWLRGKLAKFPMDPSILYKLSYWEHDWDEEQYEDEDNYQFWQVMDKLADNPLTPFEALQRFVISDELPNSLRNLAKSHPNMDKKWLSEVEGIPSTFVAKMYEIDIITPPEEYDPDDEDN